MRIFDIIVDGKNYKACCGLRVLACLQKKYGSLDAFENGLLGRGDAQKGEKESVTPDVNIIMDTAKIFLKEGNDATGGELTEEEIDNIVGCADDLYGMVAQLYHVYTRSLFSDDEEDEEKKVQSQTEGK